MRSIFALLWIFLTPFLLADTHVAASCSVADIQTALGLASAGDTVSVPPGTCYWNNADCINVVSSSVRSCLKIDKSIKLIGAGESLVNIIDSTTRGTTPHYYPIHFTFTDTTSSASRISGFTFNDSVGTIDGFYSLIRVDILDSGAGKPTIRIDHNTFNTTKRRWIYTKSTRGLVDHCTYNIATDGMISRNNYTDAWTETTTFGSADIWYVENNTFNFPGYVDGPVDCQYGGRYAARYNTLNFTVTASGQGFFGHGYDSVYRGCLLIEAYNNVISTSGTTAHAPIMYRGGTGLVFNNTITGSYSKPYLAISNYRSCSTCASSVGYCSLDPARGCQSTSECTPYGAGTCIDGINNTCNGSSPVDGNTPGQFGYPCRDQIGRGGNQALLPLYEWDNTMNASPVHFTRYSGCTGDCTNQNTYHIVENRDFYNHTASFNGTLGVGSGAIASRPATCTTGVAYYATDESKLYKCTDTDVWTNYYTPYTYPHPLDVDDVLPVVTITVPTSGPTWAPVGTTPTVSLDLGGSASDESGITGVTWINDRGGSGSATGTTSWSILGITIQTGVNVITVTATDGSSNTGTDVLTVTYIPPIESGSHGSSIRLRKP